MQEAAISFLIFQDEVDALLRKRDASDAEFQSKVTMVKLALFSAGKQQLHDLFPELFPASGPGAPDEYSTANTTLLDSNEARRIDALLAKAQAIDTGSLGLSELQPHDDEQEGWLGWDG